MHRTSAALLGLALSAFGVLGFVNRLDMFSTRGRPVLGLSSNGLLSLISVVVGAVLIAAGARGGRTASTIMAAVGAAFMLSGLGNVLVLNTDLNILAFGISNVVFSLVAGGLLLIVGAWGRLTVGLPDDNPYEQQRHPDDGGTPDVMPTIYADAADVAAVTELAEAERAAARGGATPEQAKGVAAAGHARRAEDRVAGWRSDQHPPQP